MSLILDSDRDLFKLQYLSCCLLFDQRRKSRSSIKLHVSRNQILIFAYIKGKYKSEICFTGLKHHNTILTLSELAKKSLFKNIVGKGENAGNQNFLHF